MLVSSVSSGTAPWQQQIAAQDANFFNTLDSLAYGGYGDEAFWTKQAKQLAFETVAHSARTTLAAAAAQPTSAGGPAAIASSDQQFQAQAHDLAFNGYGDIEYWSHRAKQLGVAAATHAATVASLCDASLASALGPQVAQTLSTASQLGFTGYGDYQYWSSRTKDLAMQVSSSLAPPANVPPVAVSQPSQLASELAPLNQSLSNNIQTLAFNGYGDYDYWSKQAKHIAFDGAAYAAQAQMLAARDRSFSPEEKQANLAQIQALNQAYNQTAHTMAFGGYGDYDYWSKRTKHFTLDTARYVHDVASLCDATMMATAQGTLQGMLGKAETQAFNGYGDYQYWSKQAKEMATDLMLAAQQSTDSLR